MKEREEDEKVVIGLSFRVSGRCVALVVVKKLLRRISRDRVPPSRMTCRILTSTGSGNRVSGLLDLG